MRWHKSSPQLAPKMRSSHFSSSKVGEPDVIFACPDQRNALLRVLSRHWSDTHAAHPLPVALAQAHVESAASAPLR